VTDEPFTLRCYTPADEAATIELWRRTWQAAYPHIDFNARVDWWRERWRNELVPIATIAVAERAETLVGFVTVDPATGYLDQIVVDPEAWRAHIGAALLDEARRIAPMGLDLHVNADNARAIAFYRKHGFVVSGEDVNARSGAPVFRMSWRPSRSSSC
jgi:putative acetyltransferase